MGDGAEARIAVLETRVETIIEDIHELKQAVEVVHQRVDGTRDELKQQLDKMYTASCEQHARLEKKINAIENFKNKWMYIAVGASLALGWAIGHTEGFRVLSSIFN